MEKSKPFFYIYDAANFQYRDQVIKDSNIPEFAKLDRSYYKSSKFLQKKVIKTSGKKSKKKKKKKSKKKLNQYRCDLNDL